MNTLKYMFSTTQATWPVSEKITGEIMALPIYGETTPEQRQYVVDTITAFFAK